MDRQTDRQETDTESVWWLKEQDALVCEAVDSFSVFHMDSLSVVYVDSFSIIQLDPSSSKHFPSSHPFTNPTHSKLPRKNEK